MLLAVAFCVVLPCMVFPASGQILQVFDRKNPKLEYTKHDCSDSYDYEQDETEKPEECGKLCIKKFGKNLAQNKGEGKKGWSGYFAWGRRPNGGSCSTWFTERCKCRCYTADDWQGCDKTSDDAYDTYRYETGTRLLALCNCVLNLCTIHHAQLAAMTAHSEHLHARA